MATVVAVRAVTPADRPAWTNLWRAYLLFYKTVLPDEQYEVTWARMLDPADTINGAVAELDGRAVGIVHFIEHRSCWSAKNSYYLQDLFTDESVRGRGIGRALINHVVAVAHERGIGKVHWLTHETNTTAQVLYDKVAEKPGFIQYRITLP